MLRVRPESQLSPYHVSRNAPARMCAQNAPASVCAIRGGCDKYGSPTLYFLHFTFWGSKLTCGSIFTRWFQLGDSPIFSPASPTYVSYYFCSTGLLLGRGCNGSSVQVSGKGCIISCEELGWPVLGTANILDKIATLNLTSSCWVILDFKWCHIILYHLCSCSNNAKKGKTVSSWANGFFPKFPN